MRALFDARLSTVHTLYSYLGADVGALFAITNCRASYDEIKFADYLHNHGLHIRDSQMHLIFNHLNNGHNVTQAQVLNFFVM